MRPVSLALLAAALLPSIAAAQDSGIFIQVGPSLNIRQATGLGSYPVISGIGYSWSDVNGDRLMQSGELTNVRPVFGESQNVKTTAEGFLAPGAAAGVGVFLRPSVSLRLDGSIHADHVVTTETVRSGSFGYTSAKHVLTLPVGALQRNLNSTRYTAGAIAGVELSYLISTHLSLVPQVRAIAANREWSIRPSVVMRWRP